MKQRRVVITGLGVVAPNGIGKEAFWTALVSGQSGIRQISSPDRPHPDCHVAGEVRSFDLSVHLNPRKVKTAKRMSRVSQFAVASAKMALVDSGIDLTRMEPRRIGICFGTTTGKPDFDRDVSNFLASGVDGLSSLAWAEFPPHAPTSHLANQLRITGPTFTCSGGCCTGLMVMDWAASQIARNVLDVVLVGSGDSLLSPLLIAALTAANLLTKQVDPTKASRPYDLNRDGLVPSEAAGVVLLESLESAVERNTQIYGEYLAYSCAPDKDAKTDFSSDGQGLASAIKTALRQAQLEPDQIDCINSHGLSHPVFDMLETKGFKSALGKAAYQIPITSIKSMTGASFSADGILQIISSCMILKKSLVPPTVNLDTPDPSCDLDYVPNHSRVVRVRHVLTNTRAIGGTNAVVILRGLNSDGC